MAWRVARGLDKLRDQVNIAAPGRNTASDGSIGDALHDATSDHAPKDFPGWGNDIVTARDITHDPGKGADMGRVAEALRVSRDPRIKYVIWEQRIFSATNTPWTWRYYSGAYHSHLHVSVVGDSRADQTHPWQIGIGGTAMALDENEINNVHNLLWQGGDSMGAAVPDQHRITGGAGTYGNGVVDQLSYIKAMLQELLARPAVQPAPVDGAALAAALQDPQVRQALIDAANAAEDS